MPCEAGPDALVSVRTGLVTHLRQIEPSGAGSAQARCSGFTRSGTAPDRGAVRRTAVF